MSKLSDYSKFDHIDEDDDDSDAEEAGEPSVGGSEPAAAARTAPQQQQQRARQQGTLTPAAPPVPIRAGMTKKTDEGRYVFECNGRKIYEWEQSLEEVNMYIEAPPGVTAQQIICKIQTDRLQIGLRGSDRFFIDERTFGKVKIDDSSWYLDDSGTINVVLAKVFRGETWESCLLGRDHAEVVDPATKQQIQKDLMLERFQEENPGFDFRGAEFNGAAPDPRTFMGGIGHG